ncbi:alpha/beta-hydrolase [Fomitiporia mediterranea MF3/22]|uniref:alpha/beta-hydrolase n=1 Tax=Fomitiporia mediterranea (strain MF3/22) TaxID=694068 RepID=UPI0004409BD3|nr:alpha/beta-hydrolase [Fomitiporia mediterranea MF3/22]EJD07280.1 alpha/beta-hydrolase [Fomitiporia mediterranea MF3/22]
MFSIGLLAAVTTSLVASGSVYAQNSSSELPNSFPHDYPGKPAGDFSPEWQDYFLVKDPLPNVTFPLNRNFAGNIGVNRPNHPNDTLFFWAFETQNGSLTAESSEKPWAIWLNGGPGASSLLGLLEENGPLLITESGGFTSNEFSWEKIVDYIWVDQPVGTGFATADSTGYIVDEDQMGEDFLGFLSNLVKVFPSLATRPLLLTGESYAGTYIPYIMKAIFSTENPPVNLVKAAIGNGAIGSITETQQVTAVAIIETYPQLIGYDPEVYDYFVEQSHLCGFDLNLTYPQTGGHFPSINLNFTTGFPLDFNDTSSNSSISPIPLPNRLHQSSILAHSMLSKLASDEALLEPRSPGYTGKLSTRVLREREEKRAAWKTVLEEKKRSRDWQKERMMMTKTKRDLSGRANGTIDPWYACFVSQEVQDYALNFSLPWSNAAPEVVDPVTNAFSPFNPYNLPDARKPEPNIDPTTFLNDDVTRAAIHAPTSKNWSLITNYPFNNTLDFPPDIISPFGDPSVPPSAFFGELLANASAANVPVVIYNGNDDSVVHHFTNEIVIQNTTFGGIQGFTKRPQTPFTDADGNVLGLVHQERGLTYVIVEHSGHEVPEFNPKAALVLFNEFILGSNKTGTVQEDGSVVGGEDTSILVGDTGAIPGQISILFGSGDATSLYVAPEETRAAWDSFLSSVAAARTTGEESGSTTYITPTGTETTTSVSESFTPTPTTTESITGSVTTFAESSTTSSSA